MMDSPKFIVCDKIEKFSKNYKFLSNFYLVTITKDNQNWPSSEHLFQSSKTLKIEEQEKIRLEPDPGKTKKLGKNVSIREDWEEVKVRIMYDCLRMKFGQNPEISEELIKTYPMQLIEGNYWHDNFWGKCNCERCKSKEWKNILGLLLEKVRLEYIINNRRYD